VGKGNNVKPKVTPSAQARVEIAREKARIMGKKPSAISKLEQDAEKWKQEEKLKQAQPVYREPDDSPIAIASVPLLTVMDRGRRDEDIVWKQHRLHPEERPRQIKMNSAMINCIAQRLRATEWARAMGKKRRQPDDGYNLEKAAEQWKRQKELEQRGFPGTNQRSASR